MAKEPNLITGYHIDNRLIDRNGRGYPQSHKLINSNEKLNNTRKLNGHNIDLEDNNR